jgi:hypothetical protein
MRARARCLLLVGGNFLANRHFDLSTRSERHGAHANLALIFDGRGRFVNLHGHA